MPNALTSGIREILRERGLYFAGSDDALTILLGSMNRPELVERFPDWAAEYQALLAAGVAEAFENVWAKFDSLSAITAALDGAKMDRLINLHRMLVETYRARQSDVGPRSVEVAKSAHWTEDEFVAARFDLSTSSTFRALGPVDRKRIELELFDPSAPWQGS